MPKTQVELDRVRVDKSTVKPGHAAFLLSALGLFAAAWFLLASDSGPRRYTCAICRLDRVEQSFLGSSFSNDEESDCSRWYAANVEPHHDHIWAARGQCRRFGIPGIYWGYSCRMGSPIYAIGESFQLQIYQRFRDPLKARAHFARVGQDAKDGHEILRALADWMDSGSTESWEEWHLQHPGKPRAVPANPL